MVEVSLVEDSREDYGDLARMIEDRAERGRVLYAAMRPLIVRLSADTYSVPSSGNSRRSYRVRYGGTVETCSCVDFEVHGGRVPCKHLQLLGIMFAVRRRPSVAEIAVSKAGDPFAHAGVKREEERHADKEDQGPDD
jgi:hypothetical protein